MKLQSLACVALAAVVLPLSAQTPAQGPDPGAVARAFEVWRGTRTEWSMVVEPRTGYAEFVHGGRARGAFRPADDAGFAALARQFAADTAGFTGVESETLVLDRVHYLALAPIGSSDKLTVRFRQTVAGVPVLGGSVNVLMDLEGRLLSVQSTALPGVASLSTAPGLGAAAARARGVALFADQTGLPGAARGAARLGVAREQRGGRLVPLLVWEVDVLWSAPGVDPEGWIYRLDARDGAFVSRRPSVHALDVGGTVVTYSSPGLLPDTAANPAAPEPLPYARVSSAAGVVFTDANGDFVYPGVNGPLDVTVAYRGEFARVDNASGPEHFVTVPLTGTGNVVTLNPAPTQFTTAQANAYVQIARIRDWIKSVDPLDATPDFEALAEVNYSGACNAFYMGDFVRFLRESPTLGCPNTAFSTIVAHEMGHWYNVLYGTDNALDGTGEGNADVWAMYSLDTPVVGQDMFGPGTIIRTGENARPFCGDCCPSCHGGIPHDNGEPWMGAAWKLRTRLNATHGDAVGDLIADSLFLAWMNAYDQLEIKSVIELQWLTLDDDDGYLYDGTPHYADIDGGFRDQAFPGVDVAPIWIEDVTGLADTLDTAGPYLVDATIAAVQSPPLASAELVYRVNGGAWTTVAMAPLGGGVHTAEIPGQPSVSLVEYHVRATDAAGAAVAWPAAAPDANLRFHVGLFERFFDDFEGGTNGWTHGSFGDTNNDDDDFQHGAPYGEGGDPAAAHSGAYVRGNDLGAANFNGRYAGEQHNWLRTPEIDCSNAAGTRLRFWRWLDVEAGDADQARVRVNGADVFVNAPHVDTGDGAWVWFDYDVSAHADGQPAVVVEFSLQTDFFDNRGGWTIDDVQLASLDDSGGCIPPTAYGEAKTNSLGLRARMGATGSPSLASQDLVLTLADGVPGENALLFSGPAPDSTPLFGGLRLVKPPLAREQAAVLDGTGGLALPVAVTPPMVGTTRYYQVWYRDPLHSDGIGIGLSDALAVVFCD